MFYTHDPQTGQHRDAGVTPLMIQEAPRAWAMLAIDLYCRQAGRAHHLYIVRSTQQAVANDNEQEHRSFH